MNNKYFDNASTTYVYPEVIKVITEIMEENWGNPSNLHTPGLTAKETIEEARTIIADLLGVKSSEIIFTSCASESNALAINGKSICYCSPYDHHDIKENKVTVVVSDNDILDWEEDETFYKDKIYSHLLVENETGEIFNLKKQIEKAHKLGMTVLVDGTQALGNIEVKPYEIGADYMSFCLHKCHAPKGIGILFVKEGAPLEPIIYGSQERTRRGGTENVPYIKGGAIAMNRALMELEEKNKHCTLLREVILGMLDSNNIDYIIIQGEENIPAILNIAFNGITGESMMLMLDEQGFVVSTGSACNSGDLAPSAVLKEMGVPDEYIQGAIRISMGLNNTELDAYALAKAIVIDYHVLRGKNNE